MRLEAIKLSWFRGAAESASLILSGKSTVVYGANGAGKSSFVDGLEYFISSGRIGHLVSEYSGKRQEKAIINTHHPSSSETVVECILSDGTNVSVTLKPDGSPEAGSEGASALSSWDYRRVILRQDEVAAFIANTKGDKYSALLPLLGLQHLETTAENLRQLARAIEEAAELRTVTSQLQAHTKRRTATFGSPDLATVESKVAALFARYVAESSGVIIESQCKLALRALNERLAASTAEQRRHVFIGDIGRLGLAEAANQVSHAIAAMGEVVDPLLRERVEILKLSGSFAGQLEPEEEVLCPACGKLILASTFAQHTASEALALAPLLQAYDDRQRAVAALCDVLTTLKDQMAKPNANEALAALDEAIVKGAVAKLSVLDFSRLREQCGATDLQQIQAALVPLTEAAAAAACMAPPDARQLADDKAMLEVAIEAFEDEQLQTRLVVDLKLKHTVLLLEESVRTKIRTSAQSTITELSTDIQFLWKRLHPQTPIDSIELSVPTDADKSIDIHLRFHGIAQASPRLTLSEGFRNSLGLCIFLAMCRRTGHEDRPLILDDVVVSLDRGHRGMVGRLLESSFGERQVIILTHDREWFAELRHLLDGKKWQFQALAPFENPLIGIRWADKASTFADARGSLATRPDSAGNDARKTMDIELALIAERLELSLPYRRGDRNDQRMANEFLIRIVADGKKCLQVQTPPSDKYEVKVDGLEALGEAAQLLLAWGNRASHTFDLDLSEATELIDVCEKALAVFHCSVCLKPIWFAKAAGPEWVQCQCGSLRWRFGKGS